MYETKYCNISLKDIEEAEFPNDEEHETLHVQTAFTYTNDDISIYETD